jgi:hypothetical protein
MLPSKSCGIGQCLRVAPLSRKWAANLLEDKVRMLPQSLKVDMNILQQCRKGIPLMVVGDFSPRPAPEPFDPISVGVIGRRVDQPQVVEQLSQHLAHQLRPSGGMGPQIIGNHKRYAPPSTRPGHGRPYLGAKDIRCAAGGQATVKPARTPIDEPKAIHLVVGARGLDPALSVSAFATPHPGEGGMEGKLDLVLEIDIRPREQAQQFGKIWGHFLEQVRLDQRSYGWRGWRASPSQDHLHPEAFPT